MHIPWRNNHHHKQHVITLMQGYISTFNVSHFSQESLSVYPRDSQANDKDQCIGAKNTAFWPVEQTLIQKSIYKLKGHNQSRQTGTKDWRWLPNCKIFQHKLGASEFSKWNLPLKDSSRHPSFLLIWWLVLFILLLFRLYKRKREKII